MPLHGLVKIQLTYGTTHNNMKENLLNVKLLALAKTLGLRVQRMRSQLQSSQETEHPLNRISKSVILYTCPIRDTTEMEQ